MEIIQRPNTYDLVIVGLGAGGSMAAMVVTQGGLNCALLEAGPSIDPTVDYKEHIWPYELKYRGWGRGYFYHDKPYIDEFNSHFGSWDLKGEPYVVAEGENFRWFWSRALGGRTNIWARISLRFAPYDFKPHSTDGGGEDWPISYDDVAPYYDRVERLIGVFGNRDGIPTIPDGIYIPRPRPVAMNAWSLAVAASWESQSLLCGMLFSPRPMTAALAAIIVHNARAGVWQRLALVLCRFCFQRRVGPADLNFSQTLWRGRS